MSYNASTNVCPDAAVAWDLKNAGYGASDVGNAIKTVYGSETDSTMAIVLRYAGYSATDVASTIQSVFRMSYNASTNVCPDAAVAWDLKNAGYGVNDVSSAIYDVYPGETKWSMSIVLGHAGFSSTDVTNTLNKVFGVVPKDPISKILKKLHF